MSRYCDITGAPVRTLQVFASNRVAYLYLLEGPSGVYVGLTVQPRAREVQHRCHGRAAAGGQPVHAAMRADGEQLWTFTVVGCSYDNNSSGRRFERALIAQLQDEGRNVLNADPCDAAQRGADKRWGVAQ